MEKQTQNINIFIAYSRKDSSYLEQLLTCLEPLKRANPKVKIWNDGKINAGSEWDKTIKYNLREASIVLLLISSDSIGSDYFYHEEMKHALEQHENDKSIVIPIILRACDWRISLGNLQVLPKDGKPVTKWKDKDEAFNNIIQGIREKVNIIEEAQDWQKIVTNESKRIFTIEQSDKTKASYQTTTAQSWLTRGDIIRLFLSVVIMMFSISFFVLMNNKQLYENNNKKRDYIQLMLEAGDYYSHGDYINAISKYKAALKKIDSTKIKAPLKGIKNCEIALKSDTLYWDILIDATNLFESKEYESAKIKFIRATGVGRSNTEDAHKGIKNCEKMDSLKRKQHRYDI